MEKRLNVYFDYVCPYCYRGIMDLLDLLPDFPEVSVCWIPCEAHPRPEWALVHSDLAGQAMMAAADQHCDMMRFHREVFSAHFKEGGRIDDIQLLTDIAVRCGADREQMLTALKKGQFRSNILANNRLVWDTLHFEAVPCYEWGGRLLASHEDVMIPKEQLRRFLEEIIK